MLQPDIIPQSEVTVDRLARLLEQSFYPFERLEEERLAVETDGPTVQISLNEEHHLLKFLAVYRFRPEAPEERKLPFVNRVNNVILVRFVVPEEAPEVVVADCYLPYHQGIPAHQVIHTLRLFSRIVPAAIGQCDEDDLVE